MPFTLSQPGLYCSKILRSLVLQVTNDHLNYTGMRTSFGDEPSATPCSETQALLENVLLPQLLPPTPFFSAIYFLCHFASQ